MLRLIKNAFYICMHTLLHVVQSFGCFFSPPCLFFYALWFPVCVTLSAVILYAWLHYFMLQFRQYNGGLLPFSWTTQLHLTPVYVRFVYWNWLGVLSPMSCSDFKFKKPCFRLTLQILCKLREYSYYVTRIFGYSCDMII